MAKHAQKLSSRPALARGAGVVLAALAIIVTWGCGGRVAEPAPAETARPAEPAAGRQVLHARPLDDPDAPAEPAVRRFAAGNETIGLTLWSPQLPAGARVSVGPLATEGGDMLPAEAYEVSAIAEVPVDLRRAGFVRHTGQSPAEAPDTLPRALLAWEGVEAGEGVAAGSLGPASGWAWLDVEIGADQPAGTYRGPVTLLDARGRQVPGGQVVVAIDVLDFDLPTERRLVLAGRADWADVRRLWRGAFETVEPRLLDRADDRYASALSVLDTLVSVAHKHRLALHLPALEPVAKWPPGEPVRLDWGELDGVLSPWLDGGGLPGGVPHPYWPLPDVQFLDNYPPSDQLAYWRAAAAHFDQYDWLDQAPLRLAEDAPADWAADLLRAAPRAVVQAPLGPGAVDDKSLVERMLAESPGLVSAVPAGGGPAAGGAVATWLDTTTPGLIPYVGAGGGSADVRTWAWLAFVRGATLVDWGAALPETDAPRQAGDPSRLVWFYPGEWFGREEPVPTVGLKWLRRAQQDYEYLAVARGRGETINARLLAKLLSRPVEIRQGQEADPAYILMTGTADPATWDGALALVADTILLRGGDGPVDEQARIRLDREQLRWMQPKERPFLMARAVDWTYESPGRVRAQVGVDLYNSSDTTPDENELQWTAAPPGWEVEPRPTAVPALSIYQVRRFEMPALIDPGRTRPRGLAGELPAAEVTFVQGETRQETPLRFVLPAVTIDRLPGGFALDGDLSDWTATDRIHAGPLVGLFDRADVQANVMPRADTDSELHAGWTDESLYLAFRLEGVSPGAPRDQAGVGVVGNFVRRELGRPWGEDAAELVTQAVYADGTRGPAVHLTVKPNGATVAERRDAQVENWQAFEGAARYQATLQDAGASQIWRGELAMTWDALRLPGRVDAVGRPERPAMLLFNFAQHRLSTGGGASWAGPVDRLDDPSFAGVLVLRDPETPGMADSE